METVSILSAMDTSTVLTCPKKYCRPIQYSSCSPHKTIVHLVLPFYFFILYQLNRNEFAINVPFGYNILTTGELICAS